MPRDCGVRHIVPSHRDVGTGAPVRFFCLLATLALLSACWRGGSKESAWAAAALPPVYQAREQMAESRLATLLVCADSLGRSEQTRVRRRFVCTPCLPYTAMVSSAAAAAHARLLWSRRGRHAHDSLETHAACVRRAWRIAIDSQPGSILPDLAEATVVAMASVHAPFRGASLAHFDSVVHAAVLRGDSAAAGEAVGRFANGIWERAQLMLARPVESLHAMEREVRHLTADVGRLRVLPSPPMRSAEFGVSEARWSAQLFSVAAALTPMPARSRWNRMALAPWVTMRDWRSLDSAALEALRYTPLDTGALPARALAAYRRMGRPVFQQDRVHALFDSVLRAMPRVDSARIDGFDQVLTRDDDTWRYGFLPSDRLTIEARGWKLLDPLWSTAVNEIRLARRARVIEADYRYADIVPNGASGSDTPAGQLLVRRGAPPRRRLLGARRKVSNDPPVFARQVRGGWRGIDHLVWIDETREFWKSFYSDAFLPQSVAGSRLPFGSPACPMAPIGVSLATCAEQQVADWSDVPLASGLDTIDVMVARFRGPRDSVDVHAAARLPLRTFRHRTAPGAGVGDQIRWGLIIADVLGNPLTEQLESRALPASSVRAWFGQWTARVGSGVALHRVEALETGRPSGARGAMLFTSDSSVTIPLRGFGMSDVLIAGDVRERARRPARWTDFDVTPNAAVVMSRQPFSVLWEIYDLQPDAKGRVRWQVEIRREIGARIDSRDVREALVTTRTAASKVVADEPDASSLNYTREAPTSDAVVEHIRIPLPGNASPGRHVIAITVTDLVSGRRVTRSTGVRLLPADEQRRPR